MYFKYKDKHLRAKIKYHHSVVVEENINENT